MGGGKGEVLVALPQTRPMVVAVAEDELWEYLHSLGFEGGVGGMLDSVGYRRYHLTASPFKTKTTLKFPRTATPAPTR
jgi:hypothetical protein